MLSGAGIRQILRLMPFSPRRFRPAAIPGFRQAARILARFRRRLLTAFGLSLIDSFSPATSWLADTLMASFSAADGQQSRRRDAAAGGRRRRAGFFNTQWISWLIRFSRLPSLTPIRRQIG